MAIFYKLDKNAADCTPENQGAVVGGPVNSGSAPGPEWAEAPGPRFNNGDLYDGTSFTATSASVEAPSVALAPASVFFRALTDDEYADITSNRGGPTGPSKKLSRLLAVTESGAMIDFMGPEGTALLDSMETLNIITPERRAEILASL